MSIEQFVNIPQWCETAAGVGGTAGHPPADHKPRSNKWRKKAAGVGGTAGHPAPGQEPRTQNWCNKGAGVGGTCRPQRRGGEGHPATKQGPTPETRSRFWVFSAVGVERFSSSFSSSCFAFPFLGVFGRRCGRHLPPNLLVSDPLAQGATLSAKEFTKRLSVYQLRVLPLGGSSGCKRRKSLPKIDNLGFLRVFEGYQFTKKL